jgi:hypothetical protein
MPKPYGVGDLILYRFFNVPEQTFYKPPQKGIIVETQESKRTQHNPSGLVYKVVGKDRIACWIKKNEVRRRVSTGNPIPQKYRDCLSPRGRNA